jgi:hypothetical protein
MAKTSARGNRPATSRKDRTREKIAQQREAQRRREARRRLVISVVVVVAVLGVIGGLVGAGLSKKAAKSTGALRQPAPASLVSQVQNVPSSEVNSVGYGLVYNPPKKVSGNFLTSHGKPEIVYVGAEYCPHCGAERWALVNALSRFGTFSNLQVTHSAAQDGNVPTFSFYGSSYSSKYIVFAPTEQYTNKPGDGFYVPLQPLSSLDRQVLSKYDSQNGSIPFLDFANRYVSVGVEFNDTNFINTGLTWTKIAADMANPSSEIAQQEIGAANTIAATICKLTGGQPGSVCTMPGVQAAASKANL